MLFTRLKRRRSGNSPQIYYDSCNHLRSLEPGTQMFSPSVFITSEIGTYFLVETVHPQKIWPNFCREQTYLSRSAVLLSRSSNTYALSVKRVPANLSSNWEMCKSVHDVFHQHLILLLTTCLPLFDHFRTPNPHETLVMLKTAFVIQRYAPTRSYIHCLFIWSTRLSLYLH